MPKLGPKRSEGPQNRKRKTTIAGLCTAPVFLFAILAALYVYDNRPVHVSVPAPAHLASNAYDDFLNAGNLSLAIKHKPWLWNPYTKPTKADYQAVCQDAQRAIAALRRGLTKLYLNPPIATLLPSNSLSPLRKMTYVVKTIDTAATFYEMDGRPAQAIELRLDGLQMAVMMERGGDLIVLSSADLCMQYTLDRIETLLPLLSETELARVAGRLNEIGSKQTPFAESVVESGYENAAGDASKLNDPKYSHGFNEARSLAGYHQSEDDVSIAKGLKLGLQAFGYMLTDKTKMILKNEDYYKARAAEARGPFKLKSSIPEPDDPFVRGDGAVITHFQARALAMSAIIDILQVEVALLRYRNVHHSFPASLAVLAPSYVSPQALTDPFDGKPLRYHSAQNGEAYLLYSIGPDQLDDHGTPSRYPDQTPGDIVAGHMLK